MTLLQRAIEEYLKEHHPKWTTTLSNSGNIIYIDSLVKNSHYVKINSNTQVISTHNPHSSAKIILQAFEERYNETTILALISRAILLPQMTNRIEEL